MKELVAATTAVLSAVSAFSLALLPPPHAARAACQHIGGRPVIYQPATSAPAASRCALPHALKD